MDVEPRVDDAGVFLVALGGEHYGEMAYTLAQSVRLAAPGLPIAVAVSDGALSTVEPAWRAAVFDQVIACDPAFHTLEGRFMPWYCKLHADRLSPYARTICIDVDSMLFPEADLLAELGRYRDAEFAPRCYTMIDAPDGDAPRNWFGNRHYHLLLQRFGVEVATPAVCSQYFYFRKTERTGRFFSASRNVFRDLATSRARPADGIALSLAAGIVPLDRYEVPYAPLAGPSAPPDRAATIARGALGFTIHDMPGTDPTPWIGLYDRCARDHAARLGLPNPFRWRK